MGLPEIIVNFKKLAETAIPRSQKGVVCLILKDETKDFKYMEYSKLSDVTKTDYTDTNYKIIEDVFLGAPNKLYVIRWDSADEIGAVTAVADTLKFNWITCISATAVDQTAIVTYVKNKNSVLKNRKIKGVVYNATTPDDEHIVNFMNTKIKRKDETAETDGYNYLGRLAGLFAGLPFTQSSTYYNLTDLEYVTEPSDVDTTINNGGLVIINDYGEPKIGRGVTSLKTTTENKPELMKKITIVETIDQITEDISTAFKENYVGKYKNNLDNQMLFVSSVNDYFRNLGQNDILDINYDNVAGIDVETQRAKWIESGKEAAREWTDQKVKEMTYKSWVFLKGNIKILDAIEDLEFTIYME